MCGQGDSLRSNFVPSGCLLYFILLLVSGRMFTKSGQWFSFLSLCVLQTESASSFLHLFGRPDDCELAAACSRIRFTVNVSRLTRPCSRRGLQASFVSLKLLNRSLITKIPTSYIFYLCTSVVYLHILCYFKST